jgi:hypothetical protein
MFIKVALERPQKDLRPHKTKTGFSRIQDEDTKYKIQQKDRIIISEIIKSANSS